MKLIKSINSFFVVMLLVCSVVLGQQAIISQIETDGNVTITDANILSAAQTRVGHPFSDELLADDCRSIAEIEGVEFAYYNAQGTDDGGIKVTFVVVEKRLVREVAFFGNKKLRDGFLRKQLNLRKGDYIDTVEIAKALKQIKDEYAKKGYYFAEVELDVSALEEGKVFFNIVEESQVKIDGFQFEGNTAFTDRELRSVVKLRKRKFLLFSVKLDDKKINEDIDRILSLYRENGYINATCEAYNEFNEKLNKAFVVFKIEENDQFSTSKINITGAEFFTAEQLRGDFLLNEGDVFDANRADYDRQTIEDKYKEAGFVDCRVQMSRKFADDNSIELTYNITEAERFRIGRIEITGNEKTHDKVVRRELDEMDFRPGRWYNASAAKGDGKGALESNIKRSALADNVLITPVDAEDGQKTAVVDITEGRTGMIMFGAGVDSSSGVIGQIILEQRNFDITDWPESWSDFIRGKAFRGAGQRMRLSLEPGTEVTRYSIDFTDPYAWDKPLELNVGSSKYERGRESYDEDRLKGYFGLTRRYKDGWALGWRFRAEDVKIDADDDAPREVWDADGSNAVYGAKIVAIKNNTDSRFMPSKGDSYEVNYEQVFGDYNFGVATGIYRWYKTLSQDLARRKTILATKLQASTILGDAPVFEKFYAGGTGSLRGFKYRGVSPRGENSLLPGRFKDPIGSDWLVLANAEITIPLSSDTFNWLLFCDTGMVDDKTFRSAVGAGIEILIPQWFGPVPMRFELATPLSKDSTDDTRVFSFSMGRLF